MTDTETVDGTPLSERMALKLREAVTDKGWYEVRLTMIRGEMTWRASAHHPKIQQKQLNPSKKHPYGRPARFAPDRWYRAVSKVSADDATALLLDKIGGKI